MRSFGSLKLRFESHLDLASQGLVALGGTKSRRSPMRASDPGLGACLYYLCHGILEMPKTDQVHLYQHHIRDLRFVSRRNHLSRWGI